MKNKRIAYLEQEIERLEHQLASEEILEKVWIELGPYTPHLSQDLLLELRQHFDFDDSE